jgi:hypothetical protein
MNHKSDNAKLDEMTRARIRQEVASLKSIQIAQNLIHDSFKLSAFYKRE